MFSRAMRRFSLLLLTWFVVSPALVAHEFFVYFGTYTSGSSKGIYRSTFDSHSGSLSEPQLVAETQNPGFLALHPNGRFLYAAGETDSGGSITAFHLDTRTGALLQINRQSSSGKGPCHVSVDRSGRCVMVANYSSGSVAALPIGLDGSLQPAASTVQHSGSSVDPKRQTGAHAHFILPSPDNRFALVCDLGLDKVLAYRLDPASAALTMTDPAFVTMRPGSGRRHLAFSPNGRFIYVVNEMGGSISTLSYDAASAAMKELQTISTLEAGFTNSNTSAGIAVHPSGKFVYASNRGHDSIAIFAADSRSGLLRFVEHQAGGIKTPRHFAIDPTGAWMLVENQRSNNVLVFGIDSQTGRLQPTGTAKSVGSPVCAVFVPKLD